MRVGHEDCLGPGPEVIKLEYSLKIKRYDWLLATRKQPIIAFYFEFANELKFYNLGACYKRCPSSDRMLFLSASVLTSFGQ